MKNKAYKIGPDSTKCTRCGRCVKVCPSQIFCRERAGDQIEIRKPEHCITCGHCVAACGEDAVCHEAFPAERVHRIDAVALPTPEQVELLMRARRSNRALSKRPVPRELLDRIIRAADTAPTATNARNLGYTLVTEPDNLRRITEFTLGVFGKITRLLSHPLVKPWLKPMKPDLYRYLPLFRNAEREFREQQIDRILRGATAVLVIHAPKSSRFAVEDANLAYQNGSLMAEALGVSQIYMGFVLTAAHRDGKDTLPKMLGLEGRRICAVMALGMPEFRYPNWVEREQTQTTKS